MPIAFPYRPGSYIVRRKPAVTLAVMAGLFVLLMGAAQMKAHLSQVQLGMPLPISPLTLPLGANVVNITTSGPKADMLRSLQVEFDSPGGWTALCAHINRCLSRDGKAKLEGNFSRTAAGRSARIFWNDRESGLSVVLTRNQGAAPAGQSQGRTGQYMLVAMEARSAASTGGTGGLENRKKIIELDEGARIPH